MGLISARETKNNTRGMSLLLVFFPDHNNSVNDDSPSPSPSSSSSPATTTLFRSRSSRLLLSKAQSTISICILLLFLTIFLFTLSTFEPSSGFPAVSSHPHRRFLLNRDIVGAAITRRSNRFALQGMGTLFLRGTKSMHDLIVAHIASDTTEDDLRLFMRLLHRSGVASKSDVVLLFNSPSSATRFSELIEEENESFLKLVDVHRNSNSSNQIDSVWGFNLNRFLKKQSSNKETSEPIWGKKTHRVSYNDSALNSTESTTELTHGSVVGFDVTELDPENSLSGFMDHVPISLRRWACYPMLLGRVRRNFKHVMLVDAKTSLFLGDPLTRIRNRSPDSVLFFSKHTSKKSSEINPAILIGGARGIRRLSSAMHTEIYLWRKGGPNSKFHLIHSVWANFQTSTNNIIFGNRWRHLLGERDFWEHVGGIDISLDPSSFGQANTRAFDSLLWKLHKYVPSGSAVADLYAGAGVIGLSLATSRKCSSVKCIEVNKEARLSFEKTIQRLPNSLNCSISWHHADASVNPLSWIIGSDVVVVDPPRRGLDASLRQMLESVPSIEKRMRSSSQSSSSNAKEEKRPWILRARELSVQAGNKETPEENNTLPQRLIYISCGWESFKEDCKSLLASRAWELEKAHGFNFFPGTDSIEVLAVFKRRVAIKKKKKSGIKKVGIKKVRAK